jgi:hypothetical protein
VSQAIPFGPASVPDGYLLTASHYAFAIPAGDTALNTIFNAGFARRVYCGAAGTVYLQGRNESVMVPYPVVAGEYLDGYWTAIGGTSTGSTSMTVNLEL